MFKWIKDVWARFASIFTDENKKAIADLLKNIILPQLNTVYGQFAAIAIPIAIEFVKQALLQETTGAEKKAWVVNQVKLALQAKKVDILKIPEHWLNAVIESAVVEVKLPEQVELVKTLSK